MVERMKMNRPKLNIKIPIDILEIPVNPVAWYTGDDVPTTWEPEELAKMRFECSRTNYLLGNLPEEIYRKEVKLYRSR